MADHEKAEESGVRVTPAEGSVSLIVQAIMHVRLVLSGITSEGTFESEFS